MQSQEGLSEKHTKPVIPEEAYQLAEHYRLGKPTVFYVNTQKFKSLWVFFLPASILLVMDLLFVWITINSGNIVLLVVLTLFLFLPLLWPVYLTSKNGLRAIRAASAYAYFCQLGLIYREYRRLVVLRWEEIERSEIQYGWILRRCLVMLGNGEKITLTNTVGGNLSGQIRRRLLRSRKKHQHKEQ